MKDKINTVFLLTVGMIMISFDEIAKAIQEANKALDEQRQKVINRPAES